jgi:hypothetical protein
MTSLGLYICKQKLKQVKNEFEPQVSGQAVRANKQSGVNRSRFSLSLCFCDPIGI